MSIYLELLERVNNGEYFYINFEKRNMKVGNDYLIKEGEFDESKKLIDDLEFYSLSEILNNIEMLYEEYKYSLPSERSDNKRRKYFKALPMEEITDEQLMVAERREIARSALEGFILCMIIDGRLVWDDKVMGGKWFYEDKNDPDLIILKEWINGKS